MKKYVEKVERWKTVKVLEYLNNFLGNHNGIINDNDLFDPITDLMRECDWKKKIYENFPQSTISRMEKYSARRDRLDFDDHPAEILREIWSASFARKRCRTMLQNEIKQILARPELEPVCRWGKLDRLEWHVVLLTHPQLAKHCTFGALSEADWSELIAKKPELSGYKPFKS